MILSRFDRTIFHKEALLQVAGYSRASAEADVTALLKALGTHTPLWLTEFGVSVKPFLDRRALLQSR